MVREIIEVQCQAVTMRKNRCTRRAHYLTNGKSLCTEHHRAALVKKANDAPIKKVVK